MSIYGIGARYGKVWMVQDFFDKGVACIGYDKGETPEIFSQFRYIKRGDIIYLKSFGPSSSAICVMGIGIVYDPFLKDKDELGTGVKVTWVFKEEVDLPSKWSKDKHRNVRTGTFYEEFSPRIQRRIIDMIINSENFIED